MRPCRPLVLLHLDPDGDADLMFSAVDGEHPVHLDSGSPLGRHLSLHSIGPEHDFRKVATLQYLLVHPFVAHITSAVAAGSVNQNFSAYFIRSRIKMHRATFHIE